MLSPLPAAGFGDPVFGLELWTPTVLLPSLLLRSDFGLGTMVPSEWPSAHMMVWCHLLGANRALCQGSHVSKLSGFQPYSLSAGGLWAGAQPAQPQVVGGRLSSCLLSAQTGGAWRAKTLQFTLNKWIARYSSSKMGLLRNKKELSLGT